MTRPIYQIADSYKSALKKIVSTMGPGSRAVRIAIDALNKDAKMEKELYEKETAKEDSNGKKDQGKS